MTISAPTFQRLQDGIKSVDDMRVRGPLNVALAWLGGSLVTQLNAHFNSISNSLSQVNAALAAVSQSVSVQISVHLSNRPSFQAHKNAVNQTSISAANTPITFSTEAWDIGGYFAANAWTPPAGKYRLSCAITFTNTNAVDNEVLDIQVFVGGGLLKTIPFIRAGTGAITCPMSVLVSADGVNGYDLRARKSGAGVGTIDGTVASTWFEGHAI